MSTRKFIGSRSRNVPRPPNVQQTPKKVGDHSDLTLEQALTRFVRAKEVEGVRPRTVKEYIRHVEYLSDFMTEVQGLQNARVSDLSADLIREYIRYLLSEKRRYEGTKGRRDKTVGLSVNTVNIRLRTLKTMCRFWHSEGIIESNPMNNIKPVSDDERAEVEGFSESELGLILSSFDETQFAEWRDKIMCLLLLDTGLRIQEACSLTFERVDFRTLTLYIPSQVAKNRRNRGVPVSKEVAKLLKELYEESLRYFGETEFIFNTAYGEPLTPDSFRKRLNRLKEKIGLQRISPHMFRHTFCRDYLLNGGDLFTLQKIVDHADIKTTRKYIQMNTEHVRSQHNKYSPVHRILRRI